MKRMFGQSSTSWWCALGISAPALLCVILLASAHSAHSANIKTSGKTQTASGQLPPWAEANVLSIHAYIAPSCKPGCHRLDHVILRLRNDSRKPYVYVALLAFESNHQVYPLVFRGADTKWIGAEPNAWLFNVKPHSRKTVIIYLRAGTASSYCVDSPIYNYRNGMCAPNN